MSEKLELTAVLLMTVPGVKGACGKLYVPAPFLIKETLSFSRHRKKPGAMAGRVVQSSAMETDAFWRPIIAGAVAVFLVQLLRTVRQGRAERRGHDSAAAGNKIPNPLDRGRARTRKQRLR